MKCSRVKRFLSAYHDGEIAGPKREEIARHLEGCAACRQEFEALKAAVATIRAAEVPDSPLYLATRVLAEIRQSGADSAVARRPVWARVFASAAAVVLIAAGVWVGAMLGNGIAGSGNRANGTNEWPFEGIEPSFAEVYESMFAEE